MKHEQRTYLDIANLCKSKIIFIIDLISINSFDNEGNLKSDDIFQKTFADAGKQLQTGKSSLFAAKSIKGQVSKMKNYFMHTLGHEENEKRNVDLFSDYK